MFLFLTQPDATVAVKTVTSLRRLIGRDSIVMLWLYVKQNYFEIISK